VRTASYRFPLSLIKGKFLRRANRFLAEVEVRREKALAHIPHTGRLPELLVPGRICWLAPAKNPKKRKTTWTLTLIENASSVLGCIDTSVPNKLAKMMAETQSLYGLEGWKYLDHETKFEDSRIDLVLEKDSRKMLVEVKSVTWVVDGFALFPDAPTERGIKHLQTLMRAKSLGFYASMIFVVQRTDAKCMRIASFIHEKYLETAREAMRIGVRFFAYKCGVSPREVEIKKRLSIKLKPPPRSIIDKIKSDLGTSFLRN